MGRVKPCLIESSSRREEDGGEERGEGLVVGVPARVGLDGDVLGDGHARGQFSLSVRDEALLDQALEQLGGRGRHEALGDLATGDLREHQVLAHHAALRVQLQARGGAAHDGRRQAHEGRGRDDAHALAEQQVGDAVLELGLVGRVDEVHAPGQPVTQCRHQLVHGRLDARVAQAASAEEADHAGLRQRDAHAHRGDAVGHLAADVGEAHPVGLAEAAVAQPLGILRGQGGQQRQVSGRGLRHHVAANHQADARAGGVLDHVRGLANLGQHAAQIGGLEDRRDGAWAPMANGGQLGGRHGGCSCHDLGHRNVTPSKKCRGFMTLLSRPF
jgi:hypothetical protein